MSDKSSTPSGRRFRPLGRVTELVHEAERAHVRDEQRVFVAADGFEVALAETLVRRLLAFARAAAPKEWLGLLVGLRCKDAEGDHIAVLGVVPDVAAETGPMTVATTHASEFRTRTLAQELYPDALILGWVHSHPSLGVRFSTTDRENQATWRESHHLGIVVDPWSHEELSVYRGPASELLRRCAASSTPAVETAEVPTTQPPGECAPPPPADRNPRSEADTPRSVRRTVELLAFLVVLLALSSVNTLRTLTDWVGHIEARFDQHVRASSPTSAAHAPLCVAPADGGVVEPSKNTERRTDHLEPRQVGRRTPAVRGARTAPADATSTVQPHAMSAARPASSPR